MTYEYEMRSKEGGRRKRRWELGEGFPCSTTKLLTWDALAQKKRTIRGVLSILPADHIQALKHTRSQEISRKN
jgi:hypothetical protein